ncbi:MAG: LamG domain-containing protein, partial [Lachnospiraceae bacterium]|nr:LamG domain-containing protein [Lachnospiraceae bacterium]
MEKIHKMMRQFLFLAICTCTVWGTDCVWAADRGQILYYNFEDQASKVIRDVSGRGNDGIVRNSGNEQFEIHTEEIQGRKVQAMHLPGGDKGSYLELPENLLKGCSAFTISAWVKLHADTSYQRIWDFGNDQRSYFYLLTHGQNENAIGYTTAITENGWMQEQCVSMGSDFEKERWVLTTVTMEEDKMSLYLDGDLIESKSTGISLEKLNETQHNYIGYGQFGDQPINGDFAEISVF